MAVYFSLSMSDLMLVDGWAKAFSEEDKETMYRILFENGMDVSKGVEGVFCKHRNLQGKVVDCIRYESLERQDGEWLKSPSCSWENKLDACTDDGLRSELITMGQQSNFTGSIIEHIKETTKVRGKQ